MLYTVKDVGKKPKQMTDNEIAGHYGDKLSITLLRKSFVDGVTITDAAGQVKTIITKEVSDED